MNGEKLVLLVSVCGDCHYKAEFKENGTKATTNTANSRLRNLKRVVNLTNVARLKTQTEESRLKEEIEKLKQVVKSRASDRHKRKTQDGVEKARSRAEARKHNRMRNLRAKFQKLDN